jgi:UrcA family protein
MTRPNTPLSAALSLALILSAAAAVPSFAADQHLHIGDLDFNRPADVKIFQARLSAVQDAFCDGAVTGYHLPPGQQACREAVAEEAIAKLPPVQQRSYLASRSGRGPAASAFAAKD